MSPLTGMAAKVAQAIEKFGAPVTLIGSAPSVYDPATDTWSGSAGADQTGQGIQVKDDPERFQSLGLVMQNPITLAVNAAGINKPVVGNRFIWSATTYTIVSVEPIGLDGDPIVYTVIGNQG